MSNKVIVSEDIVYRSFFVLYLMNLDQVIQSRRDNCDRNCSSRILIVTWQYGLINQQSECKPIDSSNSIFPLTVSIRLGSFNV